jgi:methyltransferase
VVSAILYSVFVGLVAIGRLAELVVAKRNLAWSRARGGVESGFGHYPFMVVLHTGLLIGCVLEVWLGGRPFIPALGWPMLALVVGTFCVRWWCMRALGPQWNTRVIVVPGQPLITSGPYRFTRQPNYLAVAVEGAALPLVHTAFLTAIAFTVLNAILLTVRIRTENAALLAAHA